MDVCVPQPDFDRPRALHGRDSKPRAGRIVDLSSLRPRPKPRRLCVVAARHGRGVGGEPGLGGGPRGPSGRQHRRALGCHERGRRVPVVPHRARRRRAEGVPRSVVDGGRPSGGQLAGDASSVQGACGRIGPSAPYAGVAGVDPSSSGEVVSSELTPSSAGAGTDGAGSSSLRGALGRAPMSRSATG